MTRKIIQLLIIATLASTTLSYGQGLFGGRKNRDKDKTEKADTTKKAVVTKYDKTFTKNKDCISYKGGFVTIHRVKQKFYAEMPKEFFGRDMLIASTISNISDNSYGAVGYKTQAPVLIRFVQGDSTVFMTRATVLPDYDRSDSRMQKAMENNFGDPVIGSYNLHSTNNDGSAVVFEVTPLFLNSMPELNPIPDGSSNGISTKSSFVATNSEIQGVKVFDDNITVRSLLSYKVSQSVLGLFTLSKDVPVSVGVTRTLLLLPKEPARERLSDSRVGIFLSNRLDFDADADMSQSYSVVHRWNLIPSDSAAWARGEKVAPTKPIVFYLDDALPEKWREPARTGIMRWNAAFEQIGFKDAVQVVDFPADDPQFDPDNLKYSCIRFVPQRTANAMGPSWVDPRSGEIINASVIVYSDVVKLINNWRFCQTAQVDPRVRAVRLPQEVVDESVAYVLAHEVGHCLGFMHNMAASAAYAVDSLRDVEFTTANGTTPSIMDYARFNYIAQPQDEGVRLTPPDLGIYDYFLVKYAYQPIPEAVDAKQESAVLKGWVDSVAGDKRFRYGRQQVSGRYDPTAIEEDLGDDAMKAGDYGIKNLKYILPNLDVWFNDLNDPDGSHRAFQYGNCLTQYRRYIMAAMLNIGGIMLTPTSAADAAESVVSVPAKTQREALRWVTAQIDDTDWLQYDSAVNRLSLRVEQSGMVAYNLTLELFDTYKNVILSSHVASPDDRYTMQDWLDDLYRWAWRSTLKGGRTTEKERMIQRQYVNMCLSGATKAASTTSASIRVTSDPLAYMPSVDHIIAFGMEGSDVLQRYLEPLREIELERGRGSVAQMMNDDNFGPSGYGWQSKVNIKTIDESPMLLYSELLKIERLLRKNLSVADADSKAHYENLLYIIDNKLNQQTSK